MYAGGARGSCASGEYFLGAASSRTNSVASAYQQLLCATAAYNDPCTPQQSSQDSDERPCVRSGTAVYPAKEAAQYMFTLLVGRYLGILSKEVLLNCLQRMHAYVRSHPIAGCRYWSIAHAHPALINRTAALLYVCS